MKLTILGSCDFRLEYPLASAGYVVQTDTTILKLDFGRGNLVNMAAAGIDWKSLDAIFISHIHADHISDLFQYLQVYGQSTAAEIGEAISIYGPRGFTNYFDHFRRMVIAEWSAIPEAKEVVDAPFTIGDVTVRTLLMKHTVDDVGYRFEADGRSMCYTGDTEVNQNLVTLAKGADLLLIECSAENGATVTGHMRPTDIAHVANEAGVKKIVLTHYSGKPENRKRAVEDVQKEFSGEVVGGQDLMVIDITL